MENQDGRLYREWPNVDLEAFRSAIIETVSKRKLRYMEDVTVDQPAKGQCLLYNGTRWVAGSITPTGNVQITDHGSMTGLDHDDHPQYLNRERALESFYAKVQIDDFLSGKASIDDIEDLKSLIEQIDEKPFPTLIELGGATREHNHNDLYYTKDEVNGALGQKADTNKIYAHSALANLESDDHKQYLNDVRGDIRYYTKNQADQHLALKADLSEFTAVQHRVSDLENEVINPADIGAATENHTHEEFSLFDERITFLENKEDEGATSHAELTGLENDDHPQYLNILRADIRYYKKSEIDSSMSNKANTSDINGLSSKISQLEQRTIFDPALYYTKTQVNSSLSNKAGLTDFNTLSTKVNNLEARPTFDSSSYFTKLEVNDALSNKANISDTTSLTNRIGALESRAVFDSSLYFNKTDVNNLLSNKTNVADTNNVITRVGALEARPLFDSTLYYTKTQADNLLITKANTSDFSNLSIRVSLVEASNYPLSEYGIHSISAPLQTALSAVNMTNGKLWLTRVKVPANAAINKILFNVRTAGSLPGSATSGVAVYSDAGALLGSVLSNTLFTSLGWKTASLTTTIASQSTERFVWIGIVCNFSTIPAIYGLTATPVNGGVLTTHRRNISITATTVFPASFTPASFGTNEDVLSLLALGA